MTTVVASPLLRLWPKNIFHLPGWLIISMGELVGVGLVSLLFNVDGVEEGVTDNKRLERGVCCEVFVLVSVGRDGMVPAVIEFDANGSVLAGSFIIGLRQSNKGIIRIKSQKK